VPQHIYPAIRTTQVQDGNPVILFSAPATDINEWVGVPQKKGQEDDKETVGFQRDENQKRIESLVAFMKDHRNIIQNPLLCATQSDSCGKVRFEPFDHSIGVKTEVGVVKIDVDDFTSYSLLELMTKVRVLLERRVPELRNHEIDADFINELKREILSVDADNEISITSDLEEDIEEINDNSGDSNNDNPSQVATEIIFSDESHILDFWRELVARIKVLEELRGRGQPDVIAGFTREAMISFLKPVVLMDGQHRLRGAVETAIRLANEEPKYQRLLEDRIEAGEESSVVQREVERSVSRILPVSLMIAEDPAEHVFQFVVVNQKATPIGKALLGTIVSTTLSNEELTRVSERLSAAGIQLQQSRAVAFLSRNPQSPFQGLIETGMAGESSDRLLAWSVTVSLVQIFQQLKGGKLFGGKIDFADKWRRELLADSAITADHSNKGFDSPFAYWSHQDGPWRDVFIEFFSVIRKEFGKDDPESGALWGNPKSSNLFNKISLTILAADFFQFLNERQYGIQSVTDLRRQMTDWLNKVSRDYFNRDWKLAGQKKDGVGLRKNWAKLWVDYRKDPQRMPNSAEYKKGI
jgi:hypothetical protein